jgi:hypothetical protein
MMTKHKAASLYQTVYDDFRKQNLKEISAEWEAMAHENQSY